MSNNWRYGVTSLVIFGFLALQAIASFSQFIPVASARRLFPPIDLIYSPRLWPFLDYPMYSAPFSEGDKLEKYFVFGLLEDSTEVVIRPEDLGLDFWLFGGFVDALQNDTERLMTYLELYKAIHGKRLIRLRLENHPLILSGHGVSPTPAQVVKAVRISGRGVEKE